MKSSLDHAEALVSVGIPCFNRTHSLERAVRAVQNQSHGNLEIIISDNASTDPDVEKLCRRLAAEDSRILYHRQVSNMGALPNFEFVLQAARGDYFMWAADDDWIEQDFIARCLEEFQQGDARTVLVIPEAQYESPEGQYAFFPESRRLRAVPYDDPCAYPADIVDALYGNIIYGLFRREVLFHACRPLTDWIGKSNNELPFFLLLASKGRIRCTDYIGLHKRAPLVVCRQAEWEQTGGWKPGGPLVAKPGLARATFEYHRLVLEEICTAVAAMELPDDAKSRTVANVRRSLRRHMWNLLFGWKPSALV